MRRRTLLLALAGLTVGPLRAIASPERDAIIRQVYAAPSATLAYTGQHAALVRLLRVLWMPVESGAPTVDFEQPLLGGADTLAIACKTVSYTHLRAHET